MLGGLGGGLGNPQGIGEQLGVVAAQARPVVSEELFWKSRAEEAEEKLAGLESRIAELEEELASARTCADEAERRREIDLLLAQSDAVDLETARLLTEAAIAGMDEPDVESAIEELRRTKPFLFGASRGGSRGASAGGSLGSAMSPRASAGAPVLGELAEDARASGDRRALMGYLRARRGV